MKDRFIKFKKSPAFTGFILFAVVLIINVLVQTPQAFFTVKNIALIFTKNTPLILVTMAQALLMLLGIIDISIGIQLSLANVVAIMLPMKFGIPLPVAWILAVLVVMIISTINGLIVAYLRIPPLLAGFAMIYIVRGINLLIMQKPQGTVPPVVYQTYDKILLGIIPFSALIIIVVFLGWLYLKRTTLMRSVYAVGGNERNAYATGINSAKVKVRMYMIAGFLTGIAGLCLTAMSASGNPIMGEAYGLKSISACILGGIALSGGWGTMVCALFGSGFLILIQNSVFHLFNLLYKILPGFQVTSYWQNLVSDGIILLGLVATIFTMKSQQSALKKGLLAKVKGGGVHATAGNE